MTTFKFISAGMLAVAMLATPAMAREHLARHAVAQTSVERYPAGQVCQAAPHVGAFATQPWDNGPPCLPESGF